MGVAAKKSLEIEEIFCYMKGIALFFNLIRRRDNEER